jgi:hypothetical protein
MIKKNHKQIFSLLVCTLLAPQALYAYTQITNDIELAVNDYAAKPEQVLVYGIKPITAGQFLTKGIHPVRLKITNKSDAPIIISAKSVSKEQVDTYQAARMFHIDNQYTSSLLLDYYLITIGINTLCGVIPGIISIVLPIIPPGSIVAAIYCFHIKGKNGQLTQDFNRALTEQYKNGECVIQPGSSVTKIVLLKKEHRIPRFTFRVFDEQNKQAVASFEVALEN